MKPKCGLENCNRPHYAKGYCQAHYGQLWQKGRISAIKVGPSINKRRRGRCSLAGCNAIHYAKGMCHHHYLLVRNGSQAGEGEKCCSFPGCKLIHAAKGLCSSHYWAFKTTAFAKAVGE